MDLDDMKRVCMTNQFKIPYKIRGLTETHETNKTKKINKKKSICDKVQYKVRSKQFNGNEKINETKSS